MKRSIIVFALFTLLSSMAWAQDGAAIYRSRCASCHGATGEGNPPVKGTSMSEAQIEDVLLKGASGMRSPHRRPIRSMTADQAKAVATYVKSLQ